MVAGLTSEKSGLPSEVTARSKSLYRVTSARSPSEALTLAQLDFKNGRILLISGNASEGDRAEVTGITICSEP